MDQGLRTFSEIQKNGLIGKLAALSSSVAKGDTASLDPFSPYPRADRRARFFAGAASSVAASSSS